jgi:hypothetical protein
MENASQDRSQISRTELDRYLSDEFASFGLEAQEPSFADKAGRGVVHTVSAGALAFGAFISFVFFSAAKSASEGRGFFGKGLGMPDHSGATIANVLGLIVGVLTVLLFWVVRYVTTDDSHSS